MKKLVALLLIAILALTVFGCAQPAATPDPTQAPAAATKAPEADTGDDSGEEQTGSEEQVDVNVVMLAPLSGPYASLGVLNDAGMQGFVARFEERGGFVNHPNWKLNYTVMDNEINAEILTEMLGIFGATCDLAENGQIALEKFQSAPAGTYQMILMDVQMPVMDGYQATGILRKLPGGDKLKIIAFSANAFEEDRDKSLKAGMNGHITKPLKIKELINELARTLANS